MSQQFRRPCLVRGALRGAALTTRARISWETANGFHQGRPSQQAVWARVVITQSPGIGRKTRSRVHASSPDPQSLRRLPQSRPYQSRSRERCPYRLPCADGPDPCGHPVSRRTPSQIHPDGSNGRDKGFNTSYVISHGRTTVVMLHCAKILLSETILRPVQDC
jgi:hypothetical protein